MPLAQSWHVALPESEVTVPEGQIVQSEAQGALNFPAGHEEHVEADTNVADPAEQQVGVLVGMNMGKTDGG